MRGITVNFDGLNGFLDEYEYTLMEENIMLAHDMLHTKTGEGSDFLGWMDLPERITEEEIKSIREAAKRMWQRADRDFNKLDCLMDDYYYIKEVDHSNTYDPIINP